MEDAAIDGPSWSPDEFVLPLLRTTLRECCAEASDEALVLRAVLEYAPVIVWCVDRDGMFTVWRGRRLSMLGIEPEESAGRSIFEVYADSPQVALHFRRALGGEELHETLKMGEHYIDAWTAPLRDEAGEPAGAICVGTVATERVRAETALLESEDRFSKAFRSTPAATVISQLEDGTFIDVNEAFVELSGLRREDIIGRSSIEIRRWANPEDRKRLIALLKTQGSVRGHYYHFRNAAGEIRVGRLSAELIELGGKRCMLAIVEDVTAQVAAEKALKNLNDELEARVRERTLELERNNRLLEEEIAERRKAVEALATSEGRWRSLVENAPDYIVLASPDGTIKFVNRVLRQLEGKPVLGTSVFDYVAEFEGPRYREAFERVVRYGVPEQLEVTTDPPTMPKAWFAVRIAPVLRNGGVDSVIVLAADITRQREAEEALRQRQIELEHVFRLSTMGEMASIIAHELNNPLCAIATYAQAGARSLRSSRCDVKKLAEVLNDITSQATRASATIRALKRFVLRREIQHELVNLQWLLQESVALTEAECRRRKVRVQIEADAGCPKLLVDPLQIEQVVVNLILNAAEAMEDTPLDRREIVIHARLDDEGMARISVIDRGRGLPVGLDKDIFDTFSTTKRRGLGMGLAISRSIVEAHEGKLWAESNQDGEGATFHMTLPIPFVGARP